PLAAEEPSIAPPAMLTPLVVPPLVAVKVPTEMSSPLFVAVPVVLVVRVPVVTFKPSLRIVLEAKFRVVAGVVMLTPDQFKVPAAVFVSIAPGVVKLKPLYVPVDAVA